MNDKEFRSIGLNPMGYLHYTDHLAPICIMMNMPLLFTDAELAEKAKNNYPDLTVDVVDWQTLSPTYLTEHYDVLYSSDLWTKERFKRNFTEAEQYYQKNMRYVHCPHGFSDKAFWLSKCVEEDITLVYGKLMLELFERENVLDRLQDYVVTGNYRYQYYRQHRSFYHQLIDEEIYGKLSVGELNILYAPTRKDLLSATSFFSAIQPLLKTLPKKWNLIVKLHPNMVYDHLNDIFRVLRGDENTSNTLFLWDYSLVYPLLDKVDIYLGDTSSIGYDFLAFQKPMFFLNEENREPNDDNTLFTCGTSITPKNYDKIYQIIEKQLPLEEKLFGEQRRLIYEKAFAPDKSFEQIRIDLEHLLKTSCEKENTH